MLKSWIGISRIFICLVFSTRLLELVAKTWPCPFFLFWSFSPPFSSKLSRALDQGFMLCFLNADPNKWIPSISSCTEIWIVISWAFSSWFMPFWWHFLFLFFFISDFKTCKVGSFLKYFRWTNIEELYNLREGFFFFFF